MEGCVDLHTHSNVSDGSMRPRELVHHGAFLGLKAMALTDHDTMDGIPEAMDAGRHYRIEVVPGVELSTRAEVQVHMLGYYLDPGCPALREAFASLQEERKQTHVRYLELLRKNGFPMTHEEVLEVAGEAGIGRAHYARVMMNKGYVASVKEAFDLYLGVGMPCYIERKVMHPVEAIRLIHEAGGVAFFAHPHQTKLEDKALYRLLSDLKKEGLDGLEGYYSEYTPIMQDKFQYFAKRLKLAISGGSDYHADMKPHIEMGCGMGNLRIPYAVLEGIKALAFAGGGSGRMGKLNAEGR